MKIVITGNVTRGLYNFRGELIRELAERHEVMILSYGTNRQQELEDTDCVSRIETERGISRLISVDSHLEVI